MIAKANFISAITKTVFFIIYLIASFSASLSAQITVRAAFETSIYDLTANQFFRKHPEIAYIDVEYKNSRPKTVNIYFRNKPSTYFYQYILTFDGDLHLFRKKYPEFPMPKATRLNLYYVNGMKNLVDSNTLYTLTSTLKPDSLNHRFSVYTVTGNTKQDLDPQLGPFYKGDVEKMIKKLEQRFVKWKPVIKPDSIIIFQGLVDKTGKLGKLKLVEGKKTDYTDKVLDFLTVEATNWQPRFDGSGKRQWDVRISVRVNKNQSLNISIL